MLADVYPTLFKVFGFSVHSFSLMVMIAYLVGSTWISREARWMRLDRTAVSRLCGYALLAVILGGRLGYLLFERPDLFRSWEALKIWHGGLVLYGGLFAVLGVVIGFSVVHRWSVLQITDLVATGGMLGLAIGRWGCFLAGDDYGKPAYNLPWAVRFTDPDSLVPPELRGVPLHPTQIYLSVNAFLIFLVLWWLGQRGARTGVRTAFGLMLYALGRSFIEVFRGDADRGFVGPLSTAQFVSIFVFIGGATLAGWLWLRMKSPSPA